MGWNTELARQTTLEEAARLTELLLRGYPNLKPRDPEGYAAVITKAFAAFPFCVSRSVMIELPKKLTFEPRQADLVLALTAEKERIQVLVGRAQKHLMQRKKREEQAAEEARYKASSPERRAALAEAARKALKPMEEENPNAG